MSKPKVAKHIAIEYAKQKGISFKLFNHTDLRRIIPFNKRIMMNNLQAKSKNKFDNINSNNTFTFKMNLKNIYGGKGANINNTSKKAFNSALISSWCSHRNNAQKRIALAEGIYDLTLGLKPNNKLKYTVAYKNLEPIGSFLSSQYMNDANQPSRQFARISKKKFNALNENENVVNKIFTLQDMNHLKNNARKNFSKYRIIHYICTDKNHKGTGIALILLEMTHLVKSCEGLLAQAVTSSSKKVFETLGFSKVNNDNLNINGDFYYLKRSLCTDPSHIINKLDNNRQNKWIKKYYKLCFRPKIQSLVTKRTNIMNYNNKNTFKFSCL